MAVITTNVRWAATKRLFDLVAEQDALTGVDFSPGYPGDDADGVQVWVDGWDGDVTVDTAKPGRLERRDDFEITVEIRVREMDDLDATMTRLIEIIAAFESIVAGVDGESVLESGRTLGGLDGVTSAEITSERSSVGLTKQGAIGFAEIVVSVMSWLD